MLIDLFCSKFLNVCQKFFEHFTDSKTDSLDLDQMNFFLNKVPARSSVATLEHWTQLIQTDNEELFAFNYGQDRNLKEYGTPNAPSYDLSAITKKMKVFYGDRDVLCSQTNIELFK